MRRSVSAGVIAAVVVIVVVVAAVGAYYYMTRGGTVYFYLTDPGNPSSSSSNSSPTAIYLTITSIMIHSTSKGWITVSNKTMTVQLSSSLSFLSSATLPPGNYTEVRLVVSAVTVQMGPVNVSASLPSERAEDTDNQRRPTGDQREDCLPSHIHGAPPDHDRDGSGHTQARDHGRGLLLAAHHLNQHHYH